jgi:hypothetical protein
MRVRGSGIRGSGRSSPTTSPNWSLCPGRPTARKSDSGLDEWLPTYQPCAYVQRYLTVAVKYQLPITVPERNAAAAACPATPPAAA